MIESAIAELLVGRAFGRSDLVLSSAVEAGATEAEREDTSAFDADDATDPIEAERVGSAVGVTTSEIEVLREIGGTTLDLAASEIIALVLGESDTDSDGTIAIEFAGLIVKNTAELLASGDFANSLLLATSADVFLNETTA